VLDALGQAFATLLGFDHLSFLGLGVIMGLAVGVFPGLGGIAGLSLLLPFLYGLDPVSGLALMVGLVAVIPTSDTFTSVLMGIPGSSASQATVLDGFPLSKQGQAARALGAAFSASLFGGLFGACILTLFVLVARPLILNFRTPELLMLAILGFSMVGVLAGRSLVKGIVAAGLGMAIGAIGAAPAQGSERLSFGSWYLGDGFQLVIVGLGMFAIPEIINLLRQDRAIAKEARLGAGWLDGVIDWWRNLFLSARCAAIGTIIGVIPGLGGSVVDWIAYGHTMQTTKDRSQFGQGEIRGVIGPESSNNAKEGGGLVPTLLFGIPGSGSMAVFLGGMVLLGLEAGPMMVQTDLHITYTIVWSLAFANVLGAGLCLGLSPFIARLTTVRFPVLAPFMLMMITFAAFQSKQTLWDLTTLCAIGVLGIYMKRFDWPRPALLIGFVLADQAEVYTYQATQFALHKGFGYLISPTVAVLALIIGVSVWLGARQKQQIGAATEIGSTRRERPPINRWPQVAFAAAVALFLVAAAIDAWQIRVLIDKVFPLTVALAMLPFAAVVVYQLPRLPRDHPAIYDDEVLGEEADDPDRRGVWRTLAWFLGLIVATALVGFFIANILFFVVFLRYRAQISWVRSVILTAAAAAAVSTLAGMLNRDFPAGQLQSLVDLPWPFR
jgi:TctA family transporter